MKVRSSELIHKTSTAKRKNDTKKHSSKNLLNFAIKNVGIETVKLLLEQVANINGPKKNSWTLLHVAAKNGLYNLVKLLIEKGVFLDSTLDGPKERGFTSLHLAVQENRLECAKLLLQHDASVSSKIDGVCDPIHLAVFNNNVEMTSLLLDHGADINLKFDNNFFEEFESPLHRSLWLDHNLPLLHYSILRDFKGMTKLLITRGVDVNLKTSMEKTTLMQAVEVYNGNLVRFLINKKNANVNDRDIFGQPVLHFLILNASSKDSMYNIMKAHLATDHFEILMKLCKSGVDVNARFPVDEERSSIIHYMIKYGLATGVYYLFLSRGDLDFTEIDSTSILSAQIHHQDISPDLEGNQEFLATLRERYACIMDAIIDRAVRDQMIGLPFNKNLLFEKPIHDYYPIEECKSRINYYRQITTGNIIYLKEQKISNSNITTWHLLTCNMNELVKLMSNKIVRDYKIICTDEDAENYLDDFFSLLNYRLCFAKKRRQLLEDCAEIIFNLFFPYLPYHCCENIVNNLSNQELILLHPTWIDTWIDDLVETDDDENLDVEQF